MAHLMTNDFRFKQRRLCCTLIQRGLDIPKIDEMTEIFRSNCRFFRKSQPAGDKIKALQRADNVSLPLRLIMDVATRCNSVFFMLKRVLKVS
jgi:hypothetical protein